MKKIIIIGDVHHRREWEQVIEQEKTWDKIIFTGDYFDSFDIPYTEGIYNFNKILELKKKHPDNVILLLGNHDIQYLPGATIVFDYEAKYKHDIQNLLLPAIENKLIQIAHLEGKVLFSHAGISKTFVERLSNKVVDIPYETDEEIVSMLNNVLLYKPLLFDFGVFKDRIWCDNYGNDKFQSCTWIRPDSLCSDTVSEALQVVGHTEHGSIIFREPGVFFIDALTEYGGFEYLVLEMGKKGAVTPLVKKLEIKN